MQDSPQYKLNLGCGDNKIEGYTNIDIDDKHKPDLVFDIRYGIPLPAKSASEVLFFHTIEHIEEDFHNKIFYEIHRVLTEDGIFLLSYPEFKICALNYIDNHKGMREFWKKTIYGLQRTKSDYHVSLMDTDIVIEKLHDIGFVNLKYAPEDGEEYNTILLAHKGKTPVQYEDLLIQEVFTKKQ